MAPQPSPQSVSAHLRRLGFSPVGSRNRAGIRVSQGWNGAVLVSADLDVERQSLLLADDLELALVEAGYLVKRDGALLYISADV